MGQKVNPHGLRVGVIKGWNAKWYANKKNFADNLIEDNKVRKFVKKELFSAGISKIEIERAAKRVKLNIYTAKPGVIIGKGGAGIEALKGKLTQYISNKNVLINIVEVKSAEADAQLMAEILHSQKTRDIQAKIPLPQAIWNFGCVTENGVNSNILQRCIYVLSDHYDFDKDTDQLTLVLCEVYDKLRSFLLALLCGCILRYTPEGPLK